ncbi:MAG TPA: prolyl oligopeptidase family serine peptidase, partial [Thermomicrobiales bacterium]|nr:prolyl oligopeptidase family serine peptidase [Thermomicrobiales bacterium]
MATGRPLEPEDLYRLPLVGDPQIAPDGRLVAYTLGTLDREADRKRSRIWLAPIAGGAPRPCGPGEQDASPRWAPDGATLAYVVTGERGQQLCLQAVAGGAARRLGGEYPGGIGGLCWAPDGRRLAFTSRTVPDGDRDRRPQVVRRLRYRHNGTGYVGDGVWRVYVLDVASGEAAPISDPDWHHFQPAWSPDGARLALVTTRRPDWDLEWVWDLSTCRPDGSDLRQLTGSLGVCLAPAWSPDGATIAYFDNRCPATGTTVDYHLWAVPAAGGEPRELSAALDRGAVTTMLPGDTAPPRACPKPRLGGAPDGRALYWPVRDRGFARIARVDADGGAVTFVVGGEGTAAAPSVAATGRLAYTWSDATSPPEVWTCAPDGGDARRLTDHTAPLLAELALGRPQSFTLPAPDGLAVESWLWLPPGATAADGPFPTLLELHGGPHGAVGPAFATRTQLLAGQGYAVVAVNFRGSGGYGQAFADAILGDWGAKECADALAAL